MTTTTVDDSSNNQYSKDRYQDAVDVACLEWEKNTPKFEDTAIIFDYDDTLLPSSWLAKQGLRLDSKVPQEIVGQLSLLEQTVINIITHALQRGEVLIITNAESGWVELSARKFLPSAVPLLEKCKIVSARSIYQDLFPDQPDAWKIEAFRDELTAFYDNQMDMDEEIECKSFAPSFRHVISFGDSLHERTALQLATSAIENSYAKSVKFVEHATLEQLKRQLEIMIESFEYIHTFDGDLDLMLVVQMLC